MHYPPEPPGTPSDQYGAAPHTDYGFITFLAQDGLDSEIACFPTCSGPDEPPRYEPVRYGDYVIARLDRNYAYRQRPS